MQRQRVDEALIWRLMRFPDEAEEGLPRASNETKGNLNAGAKRRRGISASKKSQP
jgi:hypothetical protein